MTQTDSPNEHGDDNRTSVTIPKYVYDNDDDVRGPAVGDVMYYFSVRDVIM